MTQAVIVFACLLLAIASGFAVGWSEREKAEARERARKNALDVERLVETVSATHAKLLERLGND